MIGTIGIANILLARSFDEERLINPHETAAPAVYCSLRVP